MGSGSCNKVFFTARFAKGVKFAEKRSHSVMAVKIIAGYRDPTLHKWI